MATQYTSILKLALPVQGELSGTWGDVVNDNITSMVEEAIAGRAVINTWTANSHTLTTADGTTSESRAAILTLTDTGTALTGAGTVICPAASKIYIVENGTGQTITVKTSSGTGVAVPNTKNMVVFCDGTNVEEGITNINSLTLNGDGATVSSIKDEDNMASDSATALATQQSIKAYVDSQVGSNNELSEVLANGNTTGGTDISVSSGDDITFADNSKTIFGAGSDLSVYSDGSDGILAATANLTLDVAGDINLDADGADINLKDGGTRFGILYNSSSDFLIEASVQDKDIKFLGNDGGSGITALRLDMSEAGAATFNSTIALGDNKQIFFGDGSDGRISFDGTNTLNITASNGTATTLNLTANNFTIGGASALISGTANDSVVINEASGDVDFRVESNAASHMLFLDAGNERLHVNGTTGTATFNVAGSSSFANTATSGALVASGATLSIQGTGTYNSNYFGTDRATVAIRSNEPSNDGWNPTINIATIRQSLGTNQNATGGIGFTTIDDSNNTGIDDAGRIEIANTNGASNISATRMVFYNNVGGSKTQAAQQVMSLDPYETILNEDSLDRDFRVESNNQTHALFVDAGNDRVGLGTSAPNVNLDIESSSEVGLDLNCTAGKVFRLRSTTSSEFIVRDSTAGADRFVINSSGIVDIKGAGSASTPSLILSGDDDTGQFRPSANQIAWATGGTERLRVKSAEVVVNEVSADLDFRVESDSNSSMFVVDAGSNFVDIGGAGNIGGQLNILGDEGIRGRKNAAYKTATMVQPTAWGYSTSTYAVTQLGDQSTQGTVSIGYDPSGNTDGSFSGTGIEMLFGGDMHFYQPNSADTGWKRQFRMINTSGVIINENSDADLDFRVESNSLSHAIFVDSSQNAVGINDSAPAGVKLTVLGVDTAAVAWGDTVKRGFLSFDGGGAPIVRAGTGLGLKFQSNGTRDVAVFGSTESVFNEPSNDQDFRVESNNNTHMIFVNGGNDRVGFGTNDPQGTAHTSGFHYVDKTLTSGEPNIRLRTATDSYATEWGIGQKAGSTDFGINHFNGSSWNSFFTFDTTGNLGINESSPTAKLHVKTSDSGATPNGNADDLFVENSGNAGITIGSGSSSAGQIRFADSESSGRGIVYYDQSSDLMALYTAGAERFRITAASATFNEDSNDQDFRVESNDNANMIFVDAGSNRVGIGKAPLTNALDVSTSMNIEGDASPSGNGLALGDYGTTGSYKWIQSFNSQPLRLNPLGNEVSIGVSGTGANFKAFGNAVFNEDGGSTQDFRVESNSNTQALLVDAGGDFVAMGNTVKNPVSGFTDQHGFGFDALTGDTQIASDSLPLELGRTSTAGANGTFIQMRAGSTAVGNIRNVDSDLVVHTTTASHSGLRFGLGYVGPTNNSGAVTDDAIQLGLDSIRFTSICLSQGVQFGNTGAAAELLDDYEEGTWTPELTTTGTAPTGISYTHRSGSYTKIGNVVYMRFGFLLSNVTTAGSGEFKLTGLPFTAVNSGAYQEPNFAVKGGAFATASTATNGTFGFFVNSQSHIQFRISNNSDTVLPASEMTSSLFMGGEGFYFVS